MKNCPLYIVASLREGQEKDLSTEVYAFYEALAADLKVLEKMQDATLIAMAYELTDVVRKNRTVDLGRKASA